MKYVLITSVAGLLGSNLADWKNNAVSTANIINCCVEYDVKRLVYTSSMSVYRHGAVKGERFDENDIPNPSDPYAISNWK